MRWYSYIFLHLVQISMLCLVETSHCPPEADSPTLRIITNPKVVHTGYTGNITVICNLKSKDPYNPVSRGYLVVKRGSTNETIASNLLSGIVNPFNVSVVVPNAIFRNESFLVAECTGRMDTDSCTHGTKRLGLEASFPTKSPILDNEVNWISTSAGTVTLSVVAFVLIIGIVLLLFLLYRRSKEREPRVIDPTYRSSMRGDEDLPFPVEASDDTQYSSKKEIDLGNNVTLYISKGAYVLGSGKFGKVILADLKEEGSEPKKVAVKMLKDFENEKHKRDFLREVHSLTGLHHPNIVTMIAAYMDEENIYIMMEYLAKGSLLNVLHVSKDEIGIKDLIKFARDIACGMEYLVNEKIIHRDLAARNILIGDDDSAKISDFGLARSIKETGQYITQEGYVALKWVAIETLETNQFTVKTDVWSYGIVLWEIFSYGKDPYEFMSHPTANIIDLRDFLKTGKRLSAPENCPNGIYVLMQNCWSPFPEHRPSFTELKDTTQAMLDGLSGNQPTENDY